jgi:hypothetical protein
MTTALLYKASAVVLLVFAIGHQLGFRNVDARWGVGDLIERLKAATFTVQGAKRTYWDFYAGFGFIVTLFLLFSAVLAWQLGSLPTTTLATLSVVSWAFAACHVVTVALTWRHFFLAAQVPAALAALGLVLAAWRASGGAA